MITESCNGKVLKNAQEIADMMRGVLDLSDEFDRDREHFWTIGLDNAMRVIYVECVSIGTGDRALVDPKEVFRVAIVKHAGRLVIVHNHPAGNVSPSSEDFAVTRLLKNGAEWLQIEILDHIIITSTGHYSSKEAGTL